MGQTTDFSNQMNPPDFDVYELNGLANVFCNKKDSQLLIGSQVGNIGNVEAGFGLVALVKAIMTMEGGVIPPTINYSTPHPRVPALVSGQLVPVTEPIELPGDLIGVNCHNYSGGVSHVLVKRHGKVKVEPEEGKLPEDEIPRLVILQARHEEGARATIDQAVLRIQEEGPYNLIGESWGGAVAMTLGCLLEARGQAVNLVLLGTGPSLALDRVSALCERYNADIGCSLLAAVLPLPPQTMKKVLLASTWEERLQRGLEEVPVNQGGPVGKALSTLYSQLTALQRFQPSGLFFTGNVVFLSSKEYLVSDLNKLSKICKQKPNIIVTGDDDHLHLIANPTTGAVINENVSFDYKM